MVGVAVRCCTCLEPIPVMLSRCGSNLEAPHSHVADGCRSAVFRRCTASLILLLAPLTVVEQGPRLVSVAMWPFSGCVCRPVVSDSANVRLMATVTRWCFANQQRSRAQEDFTALVKLQKKNPRSASVGSQALMIFATLVHRQTRRQAGSQTGRPAVVVSSKRRQSRVHL